MSTREPTPPAPTSSTAPPAPSSAEHRWSTIRLWEIQWVRDLLVLAAIFGLFYLGYALRTVTVPMLLALLLAYLCEPLVVRLDRSKHISREGAVLTLIFGSLALIVVPLVLAIGFATVQGVSYATILARNTSTLVTSIHNTSDTTRQQAYDELPSESWRRLSRELRELKDHAAQRDEADRLRRSEITETHSPRFATAGATGAIADGVLDAIDLEREHARQLATAQPTSVASAPNRRLLMLDTALGWLQRNATAIASRAGQQALDGGSQAFSLFVGTVGRVGLIVFSVFLTCFFFYYFSTGYASVLAFFSSLIPDKKRARVLSLANQMDAVIAGFVRGRLTICAILAVFMTLAYWFIGVPTPLILGPLVGLLFLVPFVHVIGAPIAMVLMWLEPGGTLVDSWWWIVASPIAVYLIAQFLDDYILTPSIAGKATNMDSPSILFASIAGGVLAGVYGLLVAIPVAACLKILIREVYWPRVRDWAKGKANDPLPLGQGPA